MGDVERPLEERLERAGASGRRCRHDACGEDRRSEGAALGNLGASGSTRNQEIENLLWSLYNKVDFTFNY